MLMILAISDSAFPGFRARDGILMKVARGNEAVPYSARSIHVKLEVLKCAIGSLT